VAVVSLVVLCMLLKNMLSTRGSNARNGLSIGHQPTASMTSSYGGIAVRSLRRRKNVSRKTGLKFVLMLTSNNLLCVSNAPDG